MFSAELMIEPIRAAKHGPKNLGAASPCFAGPRSSGATSEETADSCAAGFWPERLLHREDRNLGYLPPNFEKMKERKICIDFSHLIFFRCNDIVICALILR